MQQGAAYAHIFEQLLPVVQQIVSILCQAVVSPIALYLGNHLRCCHRWGIIEALLYLFHFTFIVQGTRSPVVTPHSSFVEFVGARMQADPEIIVSITGLVGLLCCLAYTAFLDNSAQHESSMFNPIIVWIVGQEALDGSVTSPAWFDAVMVLLPGLLTFAICSPLALYFK